MTTILLSAGDASGEAHAARLVEALRREDPGLRCVGLGGPQMAAAGVEPIADPRALAVGGLFEIASSLRSIAGVWRAMTRGLRETRPDLVVLVDSGGFNLPFARHVRARSRARILYYVAPQLWAWRAGRLRKLVARCDRIAVLLPFERDFYRARGVEVECVGHPLLDHELAQPVSPRDRPRARAALAIDARVPLLGILPGSRRNEVERHLPLALAAFARLRRDHPGLERLEAVVGRAPSIDAEALRRRVRDSGVDGPIHFAPGDRTLFDAIDVAVTKPGTVTVELMLRERPMVVIGRANALSAAIARRAVSVPWLAMPNLVAQREIVPELLQGRATPDRIAAALAPLFPERGASVARVESAAAREQIEALRRARTGLGEPGATRRAARLVGELLGTDPS